MTVLEVSPHLLRGGGAVGAVGDGTLDLGAAAIGISGHAAGVDLA